MRGKRMTSGLEIWMINKHAHEAVPLRPGVFTPPPGEPFVPKAHYDALKSALDHILKKRPDKVSREEAADMAIEFQHVARKAVSE